VLGRKNYPFAGSDAGGERAAAAYTLIETAKLNEVDPEAYLREVLGRIADHPINRIRELLAWNNSMRSSIRGQPDLNRRSQARKVAVVRRTLTVNPRVNHSK
jgi:hypothetical protein